MANKKQNANISPFSGRRRSLKLLTVFALVPTLFVGVLTTKAQPAGKVYSQKTFTQFSDGHWERRTCYTDGSCDKLEQSWLDDGNGHRRLPDHAHHDLKHREEVWEGNHWVTRVDQWY